jgi:hypothetical protein
MAIRLPSRAARQVAVERVAELHVGLARALVVRVGAVGRDLELVIALAQADRAELAADVPDRVGPPGRDALDVVRTGRGREVPVVAGPAQHGVAHRPADDRELVACGLEQRAELGQERVGLQLGIDPGPAVDSQ